MSPDEALIGMASASWVIGSIPRSYRDLMAKMGPEREGWIRVSRWEPRAELPIGEQLYALGTLGDAALDDLRNWMERRRLQLRHRRAPAPGDADPTRALRLLLHAGDAAIDFCALRGRLKNVHVIAGNVEWLRQAAQRALDPREPLGRA